MGKFLKIFLQCRCNVFLSRKKIISRARASYWMSERFGLTNHLKCSTFKLFSSRHAAVFLNAEWLSVFRVQHLNSIFWQLHTGELFYTNYLCISNLKIEQECSVSKKGFFSCRKFVVVKSDGMFKFLLAQPVTQRSNKLDLK